MPSAKARTAVFKVATEPYPEPAILHKWLHDKDDARLSDMDAAFTIDHHSIKRHDYIKFDPAAVFQVRNIRFSQCFDDFSSSYR